MTGAAILPGLPEQPGGLIFNIQRFSLQDGPGIRTTVFFKGCSLNCFWCHNPESKAFQPQLQVFDHLCLGCQACLKACPFQARVLSSAGQLITRRDLCRGCGNCAAVCSAGALVLSGEWLSAPDILAVVRRDQPFYRQSGGGVTLSGGEPLLQPELAAELLRLCKTEQIHTAVDTAGHVSWPNLEAVLPYTDLFLYDLKLLDEQRHRQATGADTAIILANLDRLLEKDKRVIVRIPLIPGFNDHPGDMEVLAAYLAERPSIRQVDLSPYHALADGKLASLGQDPDRKTLAEPAAAFCVEQARPFQERGLTVHFLNQ